MNLSTSASSDGAKPSSACVEEIYSPVGFYLNTSDRYEDTPYQFEHT